LDGPCNNGKTAKSITAAVTATAMTIAITVDKAPFLGAAFAASPGDGPASIMTPTAGHQLLRLKGSEWLLPGD